MDSNSILSKLICAFWFHKWDKTSDPRCYRCGKFYEQTDPCYGNLFTRETRNHVARQIKARRDLGIMDPEHDD